MKKIIILCLFLVGCEKEDSVTMEDLDSSTNYLLDSVFSLESQVADFEWRLSNIEYIDAEYRIIELEERIEQLERDIRRLE